MGEDERQKPYYLYRLHVEIEPVDAAMLKDALEDESLGLTERIGWWALKKQIEDYEIAINADSEERWRELDHDVEVLSVYLSQYIVGYEMFVRPTTGAPLLDGWKVIGRRGEVARLRVELSWDPRARRVVIGEEDMTQLVERWPQLPEWLRTAMRLKYPRLASL